jgi:hypothetical protein
MENDYLADSEEEINEDYDVPIPDLERDIDATEWSDDHSKGIHFEGEEELSKASNNIKDLVHEEFFQKGSREKVHSMTVIDDYVKFLVIIHDFLKYIFKTRQNIDTNLFDIGLGRELLEGLRHFFQVAQVQAQNDLTNDQARHRLNMIKLHFIDFPYCHRKECLSMD